MLWSRWAPVLTIDMLPSRGFSHDRRPIGGIVEIPSQTVSGPLDALPEQKKTRHLLSKNIELHKTQVICGHADSIGYHELP